MTAAGDGMMWFDRRFRRSLRAAGLKGFEAVMRSTAGLCLRALRDRENWRLELPAEGGTSRGAYLKKHHVRTWLSRLRARLRLGPPPSAGRVEAQNVHRMTADGIEVLDLIAWGERLHPGGLLESFVLTDDLAGYLPLDDFLRRRFSDPPRQRAGRRDPAFHRLVRRTASMAGRFHRAGYNHRDLYCCHFFVKEDAPGRFDIKLIDLQRVQRRRRFRRRWLVKDLAQLAYSAPRDRIGCTDRMAFIKHYLGVRKLRPADRRLIREVLAKQRRMERRLGAVA